MRIAAMPWLAAAITLTVPVACGPARSTGGGASAAADDSSARFRDVTDYGADGEEILTGAFDWMKREGWADWSYGGGKSSLFQVGNDCFHQQDGEWHHRRTPEGGVCEDVFDSPREVVETLRSMGSFERVGPEGRDSRAATHYRVVLDDDHEGWSEIWMDQRGVVQRLEQPPGGEASPRVRKYFDFGVTVHVTPPCLPRPTAQPRPETSSSKDRRVWCVEDDET